MSVIIGKVGKLRERGSIMYFPGIIHVKSFVIYFISFDIQLIIENTRNLVKKSKSSENSHYDIHLVE
jgi:hypothetical protein